MASIQFLGCGGAFDIEVGNSAAIVQVEGKSLLLDCGNTTYLRLRQLELTETLDGVLLTHLHDDHAGSLGTLVFHRQYISQAPPLDIFVATEAFGREVHTYLRHFMQNTVSERARIATLDELEGVTAIDTTDRHVRGMQSFGFVFQDAESAFAYSGDIGDPDFFFAQLKKRSLQDLRVYHDICFFPNVDAHAHYAAVARHQERYDIVGYHHNPAHNPADNPLPIVHALPEIRLY